MRRILSVLLENESEHYRVLLVYSLNVPLILKV